MAQNNNYASNIESKLGESGGGLSGMLFKYLPYWPVFVIFLIITLFGAWFYLRITPPKFEASASVMLKDEKKGVSEGQTIKSLDEVSENNIIENEIEIFQSRKLMSEVVNNLALYVSYYESNKLSPKPAYDQSPIRVRAINPERISTFSKVEYTFSEKDSSVTIGAKKYPLNQFVSTPYGSLRFSGNKSKYAAPYNSNSGKQLYFTLTPPQERVGILSGELQVSPSTKLTSVISLKMVDKDPKLAEDLLNELIVVYNKASVDEKIRLASNTSSFITDRLKLVEADLAEIEKKTQTYKAGHSAVDISAQGQIYLQNAGATDQQLAEVDLQLGSLAVVEKYVKAKDNGTGMVPSTVGIKDPLLPDLLKQLNDKELAYEKLKNTTGENNPTMTSMRDEIEKLRPKLMDNIQSQRKNLEAAKLNLNSASNSYSSILQSIPQKERELLVINRESAIKSNLYAFLLQKKEESDMAQSNIISNTRVIDEAQASFIPVSPSRKFIYILAFGLAFGLPLIFFSIKELLNTKILFRAEIEKLTSAPIIGEVAFNKSKEPIVIQEGKRTFIAEQFRKIRTSLGFTSAKTSKKKILVTSSLSGEGKSFVALNLALSLSLTDKKVVLLEFDLANPSLGNKLGVKYEQGVSSFLKGELEIEDIIKRTADHKNLFYVPAGIPPENPSELLMSYRVTELLNYLSDAFDVIIIDSAPSSLLSDAHVLSPLCDVTLYVVKHGYTPKKYLERLDEDNAENQLQNLRIVFNGIRSRGFSKNGYGYGYGYGYIHNENTKKTKRTS